VEIFTKTYNTDMKTDLFKDLIPLARIWPSLIFAALTLACQKPGTVENTSLAAKPQKEEPQRIEANPDTEGLDHAPWIEPWVNNFDKPMNSLTVECEKGPCPGAIATFIGQTLQNDGKIAYKVCGAALRDKNHIITARHCMDQKLLKVGGACSDGGYFLFPATETQPAISARCSEVVHFAKIHKNIPDSKRQPDWVLIRLDRPIPDRASPLNEKGLKQGQDLRFYKPMYDRENNIVKIHNYKCTNVLRSLLLPSATHNEGPLFLIHCDRLFSPGYSGFGFYTEDGKLAATESHSVENLYPGQQHSHFAVASNSACTDEELSPELKAHCQWEPETQQIRKDRLFTLVYKEALESHQTRFLDFIATNGLNEVRWQKVEQDKISQLPPTQKALYTDYSKANTDREITPSFQKRLTQAFLLSAPALPQCVDTAFFKTKSMKVKMPYAYVTTYLNKMEQIVIDSQIRLASADLSYREPFKAYGYYYQSGIVESKPILDPDGRPYDVIYSGTKIGAIDIPPCR